MSLDYNKKNIILAKNLRKNATPQENRLWYGFLSKYEISFQRQKAIDNYIVDFYCAKAKIVIELDGSQHYEEQEKQKDQDRDAWLKNEGYLVLRYANSDVNQRFSAVCEDIYNHLRLLLEEELSASEERAAD
mgnify:CR=1 FL=1